MKNGLAVLELKGFGSCSSHSTGGCSHRVRVSNSSTIRRAEPHQPMHRSLHTAQLWAKPSSWNVFTLRSTALPPRAAFHSLLLSSASSPPPVGHLWAHPLRRTLARESLILQIYPSPVSGSWWWQLVQKSKTGAPASSKRVNAAKTAPDYGPDPTRWKRRTTLDHAFSNLLHFSIGAFLSLISIFTVTNPGQKIRDTAFCSSPKPIWDQFTRIWHLGNPFISLT